MTDPVTRWSSVYEHESVGLTRFASMLVGPSAAEDVVSEAMIRVLDKPDVMALPPEELTPYLFRTVANTAKNHLRSAGRRTSREDHVARLSPPLPSPGPGVSNPLVINPEIRDAMARLSVQQRAVIFLTYWSDLTVPDVAAYLGVSTGSVKRQLARGRSKLGKALS